MTQITLLISLSVALHIMLIVTYFFQANAVLAVQSEMVQLRASIDECLFVLENAAEIYEQEIEIERKEREKEHNESLKHKLS